jgi:hypothetical protein
LFQKLGRTRKTDQAGRGGKSKIKSEHLSGNHSTSSDAEDPKPNIVSNAMISPFRDSSDEEMTEVNKEVCQFLKHISARSWIKEHLLH